ncbi:CPBP family intramembrane metalloprotease [Pedobacter sp. SD-b]|uniref:CPBP family intramembrane metalloprotease n=1 Tax=Pedobacter segetis TaxID=2793069 RepID=A0ABS1BEV4_9SPHI|nr:CPBP family glutamic-type intramembrane protease [Pedobacter segetis]MBK0381392.1 CPBP family intramembrane metalloprotease [Pedobacter segetis]
MIQQVFQDFLSYVKKPAPFIKEDKSTVFYNQLFPLVIIGLCFSFGSVLLVSTLENLHLIKHLPDFKLFDLKEKKVLLFFMVTVFAPILEETIFRYQLKNIYLAIFAYGILASVLIYKLFTGTTFFMLTLLVAIIITLIIITYTKNKRVQYRFVKRVFPIHFYLTAICFGLVHITNYSNPLAYGISIVLLVLPQLFLGFILGYVRMRFGLSKSMMMHAAYNLIPALALLAGY